MADAVVEAEPSTLVAAVQAVEVDGINNAIPQFVPLLRKNPNLNVYTLVGGHWRNLTFNCAKEPFSDINLRKAVGLRHQPRRGAQAGAV